MKTICHRIAVAALLGVSALPFAAFAGGYAGANQQTVHNVDRYNARQEQEAKDTAAPKEAAPASGKEADEMMHNENIDIDEDAAENAREDVAGEEPKQPEPKQ